MFICDITMQGLLDALLSFSSFFFTLLSDTANWFTSNLIGQIILGIAVISFAINVVLTIYRKFH